MGGTLENKLSSQLRAAARLSAFGNRSGSFRKRKRFSGVSEDFRRQTHSIMAQLKARDANRVFVIDPRQSSILSAWDGITSAALVYTALLTPFEVGFLQASTTIDAWFVINRLIDLVFIVDMALQFFVVYETTHSGGSGDSAWVTERKRIARHYLFGWFPLDVISILPSAFDYIPVLVAAEGGDAVDGGSLGAVDASTAEKLSGFRAIRALRLVKLVRLVRASRLVSRWKARIGVSYSTLTLFKIVGVMTLAAHWYALRTDGTLPPDREMVNHWRVATCTHALGFSRLPRPLSREML